MKRHHLSALLLSASLTFGALAATVDSPKVVIRGSNTFGEELGPELIEAFAQNNPDIVFELGTEGSGAGMTALLNGEADIASMSRVASEDELRLARARKLNLNTHFVGSYGVSVIVNEKNPVQNLTDKQVRDIFTGDLTNWKDVGGRDAPIQTYIRDPISGTYLGFQELAMEYLPYVGTAKQLLNYPDILNAVKDDPNGIGYIGMTLVPRRGGVAAVQINGIPPNALSVNEGMYPYARGLRFYTVRGKESREARAFIRFVRGREGQAILEREGYVPRAMQRMDAGGLAR